MPIEHPSFGKLDDDRIIIFDTTLRDGEQSPGFSMNLHEKLRMAEALAELGVDVMEAGFPIASPGDFESVKSIAELFAKNADKGPVVCGLARTGRDDILRAAEAVKPAERKRIHVSSAQPAAHEIQAADGAGCGAGAGRQLGRARPELQRRRGVVGRGRQPHGPGFSVPLRRGGDQAWCDDHQHPRHGRLRTARGYGAHLHHAPRARAGGRWRGVLDAQS